MPYTCNHEGVIGRLLHGDSEPAHRRKELQVLKHALVSKDHVIEGHHLKCAHTHGTCACDAVISKREYAKER